MKRLALAALLVLAAACGSSGLGDLGGLGGTIGDILGSSGPKDESDVRGTVVSVTPSDRRIDLDVAYVNNLRDNQRGSIYYDSNTVVEFENKTYRPEDLERGDEIAVEGTNSNNRFIAQRITVIRDATR
ncbi:MAG TPA: hypothetical protein VLV48_03255 [Thermoanaerobaculia bacterium]|nr:hypothetical protein [Thermoanaerobaculia bacterium]